MKFMIWGLIGVILSVWGVSDIYQHYQFSNLLASSFCGASGSYNSIFTTIIGHCNGCYAILLGFALILNSLSKILPSLIFIPKRNSETV